MSDRPEQMEVKKYLISLHRYFDGDINEFRELSSKKELREITENGMPDFNVGSMYSPHLFDQYHNNLGVLGNETHFRLTIPITLSVFSIVDLLGFLVGKHPDPVKTDQNFRSFFSSSQSGLGEDAVNTLNYIYRQGLVHIYFPKLELGVKYHSTNPKKKLFFKGGNVIFLNVNYLLEIVMHEFERILNEPSGWGILQDRFDLLLKRHESDMVHIEALKI